MLATFSSINDRNELSEEGKAIKYWQNKSYVLLMIMKILYDLENRIFSL